MILITGCGSSGTTYIAQVLNNNGLHVTHDNLLGADGIVTNAVVHDEVWVYSHGFEGIKEYVQEKIPITEFNKIIHITRHPLDVISSVLQKWTTWGKVWLHIEEGLLGNSSTPSLYNAMKYWLMWNHMLEMYTTTRIKAEDIFQDNTTILNQFDLKLVEPQLDEKIASSNTEVKFTWEDLEKHNKILTNQIKQLAIKYGYD